MDYKYLIIGITLLALVAISNSSEHSSNSDTSSQNAVRDANAHQAGNSSSGPKNRTEHAHGGHGIHVASWNFDYVREPLIICIFLMIVAVSKLEDLEKKRLFETLDSFQADLKWATCESFHHADFLSTIVPESCLLIILGCLVGGILYASDVAFTQLSPRTFFLFILPPIILEAAYSLHDRTFIDNLGTILTYAVIGTILNCFMIGPILYGISVVGGMGSLQLNLVPCLVFSALIVAVDPVAVLAIFQEIGVNNVLYFLVFGESLLNDAVTIVLYNTMKAFNDMDRIPPEQIALGFASFFAVSLGGLFIGFIYGILTAILTRFTNKVRVVEPLALLTLAYMSYITAELFHFSGIISIIGCGLVQAEYAFHNVGQKSIITVKYFTKMLSATCDCIIFMYLGLALITPDHVWDTGFILWTLLLCFLVRFLVVYGLTFIANRGLRMRKIDLEEQFIMAYGGLRGAVAFSLCTMLDEESFPDRPLFLTTTLVVVLFTVFIQGITIKPLVKLLRIRQEAHKLLSLYDEINHHVTDHVMAGIEEIVGNKGHNVFREWYQRNNNKYFKKILQRVPETKDEQIMQKYFMIVKQLHYENVGAGPHFGSQDESLNIYRPPSYHPAVLEPEKHPSSSDLPTHPLLVVGDDVKPSPPSSRPPSTIGERLSHFLHRQPSVKADQMTVHDFRKMLVRPPTMYHEKYDPNLTHETDDLAHHLYNKQLRYSRLRHSNAFDMSGIPGDNSRGQLNLPPHMRRQVRKRRAMTYDPLHPEQGEDPHPTVLTKRSSEGQSGQLSRQLAIDDPSHHSPTNVAIEMDGTNHRNSTAEEKDTHV